MRVNYKHIKNTLTKINLIHSRNDQQMSFSVDTQLLTASVDYKYLSKLRQSTLYIIIIMIYFYIVI